MTQPQELSARDILAKEIRDRWVYEPGTPEHWRTALHWLANWHPGTCADIERQVDLELGNCKPAIPFDAILSAELLGQMLTQELILKGEYSMGKKDDKKEDRPKPKPPKKPESQNTRD